MSSSSSTTAAAGKTMVLFGATGNTGKYFLPAALAAGWRVTAFLRTPSKVADAAGLTKVKGDLTKPADVADVIQGADVVVCLAGVPRGTKPGGRMDGFMTKAMKDIVAAMEQHGVRRLMFQVGGFTLLQGEPKTGCFAACCIRDCVLGKCMGEAVSLRENQVIAEFLETKRATIDWTLPRPGMLEHKDTKGTVVGSPTSTQDTCAFVDLAAWEVTLLDDDATIHTGPFPTYDKTATTAGNPSAAAVGESKD